MTSAAEEQAPGGRLHQGEYERGTGADLWSARVLVSGCQEVGNCRWKGQRSTDRCGIYRKLTIADGVFLGFTVYGDMCFCSLISLTLSWQDIMSIQHLSDMLLWKRYSSWAELSFTDIRTLDIWLCKCSHLLHVLPSVLWCGAVLLTVVYVGSLLTWYPCAWWVGKCYLPIKGWRRSECVISCLC